MEVVMSHRHKYRVLFQMSCFPVEWMQTLYFYHQSPSTYSQQGIWKHNKIQFLIYNFHSFQKFLVERIKISANPTLNLFGNKYIITINQGTGLTTLHYQDFHGKQENDGFPKLL